MGNSNVSPVPAKRYALYVRVSDEKQLEGREYHSNQSQATLLHQWVAARRGTVFKVYEDTESGTLLEQRPGLMALVADAYDDKFDEAVAYNFDRWARSVEITMFLKRITKERGVRFVSATQEFADTPEGELIENQLATINQYYSRVISAKVKIKRRLKTERGEWNGGKRPYGFTSEQGKLIAIPGECDVVRQIYQLFIEHPSATTVRNRLTALGLKDRKGRTWSNSAIEWILKNPIYAGHIRGVDGGIAPAKHETIIPLATWQAVQALVPTRKRLRTKIERGFPLVGVLECGGCGQGMTAHYVAKSNGRKIPRYRCTTTFKRGWSECSVREVHADRIERWVLEQVRALQSSPELLEGVIAKVNEEGAEEAHPLRARETELAKRILEVRGAVDNLVNALASGGSAFHSIKARLAMEERNLTLLEQEKSEVHAEINRRAGEPLDADEIRDVLGDFGLLYDVGSDDQKKELLQLLVKTVVFNGPGKDVTLEFRADANLSSPGSISRAVWLRQ